MISNLRPTSQKGKDSEPHADDKKDNVTTFNPRPTSAQSQKAKCPIPFIAWKKEHSSTGDPFDPINTITPAAPIIMISPVASLVEDLVNDSDGIALGQKISTSP